MLRMHVNCLTRNALQQNSLQVAGLKGYYGRYLAYVYVNGTDFNALLVKNGLARVYKEGEFRKKAYYLQLEEIARSNKTGLWRIAEW